MHGITLSFYSLKSCFQQGNVKAVHSPPFVERSSKFYKQLEQKMGCTRNPLLHVLMRIGLKPDCTKPLSGNDD